MPGDESITDADARVVDLVKKLMAKAAASAHPQEADAFAQKAAELVSRHRIDPDQLHAVGRDDHLALREIPLGRGAYVRGRLALLTSVAEANDARVVFGSTPEGTMAYVAGYTNDLDVVEVIYHSLHAQMASQMARERRSTAAATQRFRRSFMFGFADRTGKLLQETRRVVEANEPGESTASQLPALAERTKRVDAFVNESFGRVRAARASVGAEVGGWTAGSDAAAGADVGRQRLRGRRALGPGR